MINKDYNEIPNNNPTEMQYEMLRDRVERARNMSHSIVRVLGSANTGGIIACLSIIGAFIGSGAEASLPKSIYWIMCLYLCGMFSSWVARFSQATYEFAWARKIVEDVDGQGSLPLIGLPSIKASVVIGGVSATLSSTMFLSSSIWGMFVLFDITQH